LHGTVPKPGNGHRHNVLRIFFHVVQLEEPFKDRFVHFLVGLVDQNLVDIAQREPAFSRLRMNHFRDGFQRVLVYLVALHLEVQSIAVGIKMIGLPKRRRFTSFKVSDLVTCEMIPAFLFVASTSVAPAPSE